MGFKSHWLSGGKGGRRRPGVCATRTRKWEFGSLPVMWKPLKNKKGGARSIRGIMNSGDFAAHPSTRHYNVHPVRRHRVLYGAYEHNDYSIIELFRSRTHISVAALRIRLVHYYSSLYISMYIVWAPRGLFLFYSEPREFLGVERYLIIRILGRPHMVAVIRRRRRRSPFGRDRR